MPRKAPPPTPEPAALKAYLRRRALRFLQRYSASRNRVARLLMEHAEPAIREHAIDRQAVRLDVASILDDLERMALLNDASFALGRARREFHQGRSTGRIEQRLQALGVDRDTAKDAVTAAKAEIAGAEDDPDGDTAERYAAKRYAERRRLGPWRAPDERSAKREHDLARLIRQGFSFPLARSVIDGGG